MNIETPQPFGAPKAKPATPMKARRQRRKEIAKAPARNKAKPEKLSRKSYEKEMEKLQVKLCHLQDWARETGARVVIVLEGRDTAGKGGLIKRITERVSPRTFRVVALSAPTERDRSKLFLQRFIEHVPKAERWMVEAGIILIKLWLEVGMEEQERRFRQRIDDPLRQWKL